MDSNPKIAVIIVNYNVAFFLEQCLNSVAKAMLLEPAEVWVVDNNSVDGSIDLVREKFPWVKLIANKDNKGFSKANNQAMELSPCKYQLLLNPDTVIEEDTLQKVVRYMDEHPEVGGLGVRMVDGKGNFLPESKRGLPTPAVAFYKIFGISRLFPKSKRFGKYHLGYLSEFETNEIEILSGAFMLMRKALFQGLPEQFEVGLYHSWAVDVQDDSPLIVTSLSETNIVMSLEHQSAPIYGVQFHPESIMTPDGRTIIENFLKLV
jgi:GT2 family glycosyltransferase